MGMKARSDGLGADKQSRLSSGRWPVQKPSLLRGLQPKGTGISGSDGNAKLGTGRPQRDSKHEELR